MTDRLTLGYREAVAASPEYDPGLAVVPEQEAVTDDDHRRRGSLQRQTEDE